MIENYHFLSKMEKMSKKKDVLVQRILDQYELDDSAEFSSLDVFESFLENKQSALVSPEMLHIEERQENADFDDANTKDTDEEIDYDILSEAELIDLANDGDVEAMIILGSSYYGEGREEFDVDYDEAAKWFKKLADKGDALGLTLYGECCYYGYGVRQNKYKAVEYLQMALEDVPIPRAQGLLGHCYFLGEGVSLDSEKAEELLCKAVEGGNTDALFDLGCLYRYHYEIGSEAIHWFEKAGEAGSAYAYTCIGEIYREGEIISRNYARAYDYFKKAADDGDEDAQNYLGLMFLQGEHVQENDSKAFQYFKKAAEQDLAAAQCNLGKCYYYGWGTQPRMQLAQYYLKKAADQDFEPAQEFLDENF